MAEWGASFGGLAHTFTLTLRLASFRRSGGTRCAAAAGTADRFGSLVITFGFLLGFLAIFGFLAIQFYDRLLENCGRHLLAVLVRLGRSSLRLPVAVLPPRLIILRLDLGLVTGRRSL